MVSSVGQPDPGGFSSFRSRRHWRPPHSAPPSFAGLPSELCRLFQSAIMIRSCSSVAGTVIVDSGRPSNGQASSWSPSKWCQSRLLRMVISHPQKGHADGCITKPSVRADGLCIISTPDSHQTRPHPARNRKLASNFQPKSVCHSHQGGAAIASAVAAAPRSGLDWLAIANICASAGHFAPPVGAAPHGSRQRLGRQLIKHHARPFAQSAGSSLLRQTNRMLRSYLLMKWNATQTGISNTTVRYSIEFFSMPIRALHLLEMRSR